MSSPAESSTSPRLFAFDASDTELSLLPLCARRALDLAGIKLSLQAYQSFDIPRRYELARLGSCEEVDVERVRELIQAAEGAQVRAVLPDPAPDEVPSSLRDALGPDRPLSDKVWQGLSALERYALVKIAIGGKARRVDVGYSEIVGAQGLSTHLKPGGGVRMVSISKKAESSRRAVAESWVTMSRPAYDRLVAAEVPKGDVLGTARLAGIMATKKTADLIPLCHPLALEHAEVDFDLHPEKAQVRVTCAVQVHGRTGVEMEAMVGASTAALTIYDMLKSIDRELSIGPTQLIEKSGGRSGDFRRHFA